MVMDKVSYYAYIAQLSLERNVIITGNIIGLSVETAVKDCKSSHYKKVHMCYTSLGTLKLTMYWMFICGRSTLHTSHH